MSRSGLIDMRLELRAETDKAILVKHELRRGPMWLPKSQVEWASSDDGKAIVVTAPEWLLLEKGLL